MYTGFISMTKHGVACVTEICDIFAFQQLPCDAEKAGVPKITLKERIGQSIRNGSSILLSPTQRFENIPANVMKIGSRE